MCTDIILSEYICNKIVSGCCTGSETGESYSTNKHEQAKASAAWPRPLRSYGLSEQRIYNAKSLLTFTEVIIRS